MWKFITKPNTLKPIKCIYSNITEVLPIWRIRLNNFSTCGRSHAKCELTAERYNVKRGPFKSVTNEDINYFKEILEDHRIITNSSELEGHNTDWLATVRGSSSVLLKPKTTNEVSKILSYCNEKVLAICPQGGNTGLVGGSVPVFDEIILSSMLMNKVESVDPLSGNVICQAGCVLEALDQHVSEYGLMMPLDLGAKGSCNIGGNISTNAGGIRVLRYGNLHGSVLGVEAVLASGEVIDCLSSMKKDNTGYDLKHLFIGSEGTLGVITKVAISCPTKPQVTSLAFLGLENFEDVLQTFKDSKSFLAEILSACEFIDRLSMDSIEKNLKLTSPIKEYPFYMVIETSGSNSTHDEEKLNNFLESAMERGTVCDGTVVTEPSRMKAIWELRERIAEALLYEGYVYKYDVSIPLPVFYQIVEVIREKLGSDVGRVCGYGHVGDGNLHLNITSKKFQRNILHKIEPFVYEEVSRHRGSVSAEHGIGFKKRNFMKYSKAPNVIGLMKQIKFLFDPKGILNPYKVLPDE